jgi:hypothetical protein
MVADRGRLRVLLSSKEVLRLKLWGVGSGDFPIGPDGRTAIAEYVRRAAVIGITWPMREEINDRALERKLFAPAGYNPPRSKPLPDRGMSMPNCAAAAYAGC